MQAGAWPDEAVKLAYSDRKQARLLTRPSLSHGDTSSLSQVPTVLRSCGLAAYACATSRLPDRCCLSRSRMAECICDTRLSERASVSPISFIVISSK